jgi:hypothetical protein
VDPEELTDNIDPEPCGEEESIDDFKSIASDDSDEAVAEILLPPVTEQRVLWDCTLLILLPLRKPLTQQMLLSGNLLLTRKSVALNTIKFGKTCLMFPNPF